MMKFKTRIRQDNDRGVGTIEFLGIVALVAILVAGVVVGTSQYPGEINSALCRISNAIGMGSGSCDGGDGEASEEGNEEEEKPTDEDFRPEPCMYKETSIQTSASVQILWVKFGQDAGFIVQQFADGSVKATAVNGVSLGASYEKEFDGGAVGAKVELGAGLTFGYGDTWEFDSMAKWESMKAQMDAYNRQQTMLMNDQYGGYALYLWLSGNTVAPPDPPTTTYFKVGIEAGIEAGLNVGIGNGGSGSPGAGGPKAGVGLALDGSAEVMVESSSDGSKSYTYTVSGEAEAGVSYGVGEANIEGKIEGAFTVTRNKAGKVTELTFNSMYEHGVSVGVAGESEFPHDAGGVEGGASVGATKSVVTTTTLAVTDANRDIVNEWMGRSGIDAQGLGLASFIPSSPADDPFEQLMYLQGKTSQIEYENIKGKQEFDLSIKNGWKFGFNLSLEESTAEATNANFLGAPDANGVRQFIPDETCTG